MRNEGLTLVLPPLPRPDIFAKSNFFRAFRSFLVQYSVVSAKIELLKWPQFVSALFQKRLHCTGGISIVVALSFW